MPLDQMYRSSRVRHAGRFFPLFRVVGSVMMVDLDGRMRHERLGMNGRGRWGE